jgi:lipoyl(octanoyl) transferase
MEEALIRLCAGYGILTGRVAGRTGVWTTAALGREKKIGAIGVHVSRGITSHGFALNVTTDLRDFQWIVPCGIADREVTSLELEMPAAQDVPTLEQAANAAARHFGHVFAQPVLAVASLDELRSNAYAHEKQYAFSDVQQVGVPMQIPKEIKHLNQLRSRGDNDRDDGPVGV